MLFSSSCNNKQLQSGLKQQNSSLSSICLHLCMVFPCVCVCVCVCMRERKRERERVCLLLFVSRLPLPLSVSAHRQTPGKTPSLQVLNAALSVKALLSLLGNNSGFQELGTGILGCLLFNLLQKIR